MIGPKVPNPSRADENDAYEHATLRDRNSCVRCRHFGDVNRDHRKGRGVGGLTVVENLQLLCGTGTTGCHGWKGANPKAALDSGLTVPGWADPAEYPGRRWVKTQNGVLVVAWCMYRADGSIESISDEVAAERREGLVA